MRYYAVAELEVRDPAWVRDYIANVTPLVERRGGRYLARSAGVHVIEGDRPPPPLVLIIEWPSREAAEEFYDSEEYRPYREARRAGSSGDFLLISGEDLAERARIDG